MLLYDAVNYKNIPPTAPIVVGYINGPKSKWPDTAWSKFPNSIILKATVNIFTDADILDVESSDATPTQVPIWLAHFRKPNQQRTIYCGLNSWPAVQAQVKVANLQPPYYWIADQTNIPHLVANSNATQYTDYRTLFDESTTDGEWPQNQLLANLLHPETEMAIVVVQTGPNDTNKVVLVEKSGTNTHAYVFSVPLSKLNTWQAVQAHDLTASLIQQGHPGYNVR